MNLTSIIIIVFVIILYSIVRILTSKITVKMRYVFAGHPSSVDNQNIAIFELPKNNPKYKIGNETVNMTGLQQFVVKGKSMEYFGINDGSFIFVKEFKKDEDKDNEEFLKTLIGRFVVFNIDNDRTVVEYPLKNITIVEGGLKLRKVVGILKNKDTNIKDKINAFLEKNDADYQKFTEEEKKIRCDKYVKKYKFASSYYVNDNNIIMSVTYKGGIEKDYSFHSPTWLYGKVEYNTK
mgnify:FL=1